VQHVRKETPAQTAGLATRSSQVTCWRALLGSERLPRRDSVLSRSKSRTASPGRRRACSAWMRGGRARRSGASATGLRARASSAQGPTPRKLYGDCHLHATKEGIPCAARKARSPHRMRASRCAVRPDQGPGAAPATRSRRTGVENTHAGKSSRDGYGSSIMSPPRVLERQ